MHLCHEGSMIGVQCSLMIFRGHNRINLGSDQFCLKICDLWKLPHLSAGCVLLALDSDSDISLRFRFGY